MTTESALSFSHLVVPVLGLLVPILGILAHYVGEAYAVRQRHLTLREYVRAGQPVPPELLSEFQERPWLGQVSDAAPVDRLLLAAVINAALGLGVTGLFAVMRPNAWLWAIGLLPLALGLGLGLLWALQRRHAARG